MKHQQVIIILLTYNNRIVHIFTETDFVQSTVCVCWDIYIHIYTSLSLFICSSAIRINRTVLIVLRHHLILILHLLVSSFSSSAAALHALINTHARVCIKSDSDKR